ncbi:MAG: nucleoside triphosphate pyrophosphohydrolase [Halioglobus sp.]|nr:nucleoside triphosphate pyrophosphohydrolase [Halioglobus sp.]
MSDETYSLADLLRVMQRLRDPDGGCPWDLAQDFDTIVPSTLEECYELVAAIEAADYEHVAEELGDVLFQVIFYAQLGAERSLFDFPGVVHTLTQKLVRRHPHVFIGGELEGRSRESTSVEAVKTSWEAIKREERAARSQTGVLADIPTVLPALSRAQKVQKRAAQVNFDWGSARAVLDKLEEEVTELREALDGGNTDDAAEELGDVLFSAVNLARHIKVDAEQAMRHATRKFERRFEQMEKAVPGGQDALARLSASDWDELWRMAKDADL